MNRFRDTSSLHIQSEFWQQRGDYLLNEVNAQFLCTILLLSSDHLEELEANVCPFFALCDFVKIHDQFS